MNRRLFLIGLALTLSVRLAHGAHGGGFVVLEFDTSLESLNLSGGPYPMPLASDPGNLLGDSVDGFGFVDSVVTLTLSSQRPVDPGPDSLGTACAFFFGDSDGEASLRVAQGCGFDEGPGGGDPQPINPSELDGHVFFVDSFFDVFFDITVTDVDSRPGRDFAGQSDGAAILLTDNGPANMQSSYSAIFDAGAPNFGLVPPPQVSPYIGHFLIEIPLGGDINGNGENDKIKFTIASHAAGDENRTFTQLPDGTIIDEFDSAAFLAGAIVDESTDPPFTLGAGSPSAPAFTGPGALTGPTTATSTLLNPVVQPPLEVSIDIKPGSDVNPVNLKSNGVLPVAILTTSIADGDAVDFGASTVDTSTIQFGDTGSGLASVSALRTSLEDVDGDGDLDVIVHFSMRDIKAAGALDADSVDAVLSAKTISGGDIFGSDSLRIVPRKK
jgi:hypothetical protein